MPWISRVLAFHWCETTLSLFDHLVDLQFLPLHCPVFVHCFLFVLVAHLLNAVPSPCKFFLVVLIFTVNFVLLLQDFCILFLFKTLTVAA